MNTGINLPSPASQIVGKDGQLSPEWFGFFLSLFNRTGAAGTPIDITSLQKIVNQHGGQIGDLFKLVNGQNAAPLFAALLQRVIALEIQAQGVVPLHQSLPQALPDAMPVRAKDPSTDLYKMMSK